MPLEGVKWIFPTAATIPITLNGGMKMTGWYDINDLSVERIVDDREQTMQVGDSASAVFACRVISRVTTQAYSYSVGVLNPQILTA